MQLFRLWSRVLVVETNPRSDISARTYESAFTLLVNCIRFKTVFQVEYHTLPWNFFSQCVMYSKVNTITMRDKVWQSEKKLCGLSRLVTLHIVWNCDKILTRCEKFVISHYNV